MDQLGFFCKLMFRQRLKYTLCNLPFFLPIYRYSLYSQEESPFICQMCHKTFLSVIQFFKFCLQCFCCKNIFYLKYLRFSLFMTLLSKPWSVSFLFSQNYFPTSIFLKFLLIYLKFYFLHLNANFSLIFLVNFSFRWGCQRDHYLLSNLEGDYT